METRANYVLIGAFTLGVIAAAFSFVLWFQSLHSAKLRQPLRIVFEGPVAGLRNGGSVNFNGIRVGEVVSVKLENPKRVVALAMIDSAPVRNDTLVGLEFQGLTGVAAISLKGGALDAPPVAAADDGVPTLTADPTALQDLSEAVRATLQNINRVVLDNQETVKSALKNLETFTASLANNSDKIESIVRKTDSVMGQADGIMKKVDNAMTGIDLLTGGKDGGKLAAAIESFKELADNLDKRSGALIVDGRRLMGDISRAVNNLDRDPRRLLFGPSANSAPAAPAATTPPTAAQGQQRR